MGRGACLSKESGEGVSQYFSQKQELELASCPSCPSYLLCPSCPLRPFYLLCPSCPFEVTPGFGIDAEVVSK